MQICCVSPTPLGLSMPPPSAKYAQPPSALSIPYPPALSIPCPVCVLAQPVKRLSCCSCLSCPALACRQLSFPQSVGFLQWVFPSEFPPPPFRPIIPLPKLISKVLWAFNGHSSVSQPAFCSIFVSVFFVFFFFAFYAFSVIFFSFIFHIFTFSCAQIQLAKINIAHTPRCLNNINY